jgi:hypothetical protein
LCSVRCTRLEHCSTTIRHVCILSAVKLSSVNWLHGSEMSLNFSSNQVPTFYVLASATDSLKLVILTSLFAT